MLHAVSCITWCVHRFDASCSALSDALGYARVADGNVDETDAQFWRAARVRGRRFAVYQPASGEACYLRFIECEQQSGYSPLRTFGWNATEIHVADVHALAARLRDSPYTIIGGPRDLLGNGTAVALQVRGPSDEIFYLTEINSEAMRGSYGRARAFVGRPFIVVLGASQHAASLSFYGDLAGRKTRARPFPIRVLSAAHGLDGDATHYPIASAVLRQQFRIEIDGYPDSATARPIRDDDLAPGMAIVSFTAPDISAFEHGALAVGERKDIVTKRACRAALLAGPDGETLEILESTTTRD